MNKVKQMKMRVLSVLRSVFAVMLAGCSGLAPKSGDSGLKAETVPPKEVIPFVGTFKVNRYTLDNGLRLLVVEDHSSPTFAYQTWFRVGSRDEVRDYTGLAHLFEHMMFKETKSLREGEFDRILESSGAEGENAFTSRDYTAYIQEMPSDKLELIAKLEADRMVNLIVNEKAFKTETEVVQNERRFRNENSPDGSMHQALFELAFKVHPYHWPVIGYQADLGRMTAADALKFYHSYYSPNHATIVAVGDLQPDAVFANIRKHYGAIPAQPSLTHPIDPEPPQTSPRHLQLKLNIQVEKLIIGYHVPGVSDPDIPILNVLQAVLAGGKSSRLHRALVDTGISSSVEAYDLEDKDPSLFLIATNLQTGKKATQAENIVLKEISRLVREPISEQELERAKNKIGFGFYGGLDNNYEKARFLGFYEAAANTFELGLNQQKRTQTVGALEVHAAAKKYLDPKNRSVVVGVRK